MDGLHFICLLACQWHLGCFHVWWLGVMLLWTWVCKNLFNICFPFLWVNTQKWVAPSCGNSMFKFLRNCRTVFHSAVILSLLNYFIYLLVFVEVRFTWHQIVCNSVTFNTFTISCSHRLHLVPEHSHHPKSRPCPHEQSLPISLPRPWHPQICFCLYGCAYSGRFLYMGSHTVWPFVSGFSLSVFLRFIRTVAWVRASLLFTAKWYFVVWMDHLVLMCLSVDDGHLGGFSFLFVNVRATICTLLCGFMPLFLLHRYLSWLFFKISAFPSNSVSSEWCAT